MSTLSDRLAALRDKYDSILKPDIAEKMERNIEELRSDGTFDRVLKEKGPLVVHFNCGAWCPYCNEEIAALAEAYPQIRKAGAELVAITPQSTANAQSYIDEQPVPFSILVDEDLSVAEAFGVAYTLPTYLQDLYKTVFANDLSLANASKSWQLPIPARFVLATDGTIVDVKADPDYRCRPDPEDTLVVMEREFARAPG